MNIPRPIIPAPAKVPASKFPAASPLEPSLQETLLTSPAGPQTNWSVYIEKRRLKLKNNKSSFEKWNQVPGHQIYLLICQQVGGDPEAKKVVTVDGGNAKTARTLRVNFYSWRAACVRELGEDFVADNHLSDVKIYLDPVVDAYGKEARDHRRMPIPNGRVTFYSVRSMKEVEALQSALPQLGVTL